MTRIHCKGILTNSCDKPLNYGYIVIERTGTDEEYSIGLDRTRYKLDGMGNYDFFLKEGYYNIYSMEDRDATRSIKIFKVTVTTISDKRTIHSFSFIKIPKNIVSTLSR